MNYHVVHVTMRRELTALCNRGSSISNPELVAILTTLRSQPWLRTAPEVMPVPRPSLC